MLEIQDVDAVNAAWEKGADASPPFVKFPTKLIGLLADDRGKWNEATGKFGPSRTAYAAHLALHKINNQFWCPEFTLCQRDVKKRLNLGEDAFESGISLLIEKGVIERNPHGAGRYALETAIDASGNYVPVPSRCLGTMDSKALFFALLVMARPLSAGPIKPKEIAARLGVTARNTIRNLWQAAEKEGLIEVAHGARDVCYVGRKGTNFDLIKKPGELGEVVKNPPIKKPPIKKPGDQYRGKASHANALKVQKEGRRRKEGSSSSVVLCSEVKGPKPQASPASRDDAAGRALETYNAMAMRCGLSQAHVTEERRKALTVVLEHFGFELWERAVGMIEKTPFLLGQGTQGFQVSITWLTKPVNFAKVVEGAYEDRKATGRRNAEHAKVDRKMSLYYGDRWDEASPEAKEALLAEHRARKAEEEREMIAEMERAAALNLGADL